MTEEIKYKDIKALDFKEIVAHDVVFEREYGYQYKILEKKLTKNLYIDWDITTRKCKLVRTGKKYEVKAERAISNLEELKDLISFFTVNEKINETI